MKRNQRQRGHSGFSGPLTQAPVSATGGPLMTEHLHLHDLDLELALLKRKREIIQQQHDMLVSDQRYSMPSHEFNQPQSYEPPQTFNRAGNFSRVYDVPPGHDFRSLDRQFGTKRHAFDDDWQTNHTPKRFGPSPRAMPKPFPNRSEIEHEVSINTSQKFNYSPSHRPVPLMGPGFKPRAARPHKDFKPTKVTKSKVSAYVKPCSPAVAQRKAVAYQAIMGSENFKAPVDNILHADQPGSPQLVGRLELALGMLLKELRMEYGELEPHVASFTNTTKARALKQAIRERIRGVMLGKFVGTAPHILAAYRVKYPKHTDKELLDIARETVAVNVAVAPKNERASEKLAIKLVDKDTPELYFKQNFNKLLHFTLDKMFEQLLNIYQKDPSNEKSTQELVDTIAAEEGIDDPKENGDKKTTEVSESVTNGEVKNNSDATEGNDEVNKEEKKEGDENMADETKTDEESTRNESNSEMDIHKSPSKEDRAKFYDRTICTLLKKRLPIVLPKFKECLIRILNLDETYLATKAAIEMETNKKGEIILNRQNKATEKAVLPSTPPSQKTPPKFFVKIMGRPNLPKRQLMQAFLDQYKPLSIKKHRGIHNLLFIGLGEKTDYEAILAANNTVFGKSTLDIRTSESFKPNQNHKKGADRDVEIVDPTETIKIDEDLDNQITDLLTLIRKEEEMTDGEDQSPDNPEKVKDTEESTPETEKEVANGGSEVPATEAANDGDKVNGKGVEENGEQNDKVAALKSDTKETGKGTPTRASARIATTPRTITTRRSSKLEQN